MPESVSKEGKVEMYLHVVAVVVAEAEGVGVGVLAPLPR